MDKSRTRTTGLPDTPNRIERHSLHDAILTRLRDMIIEGELAPGTRINEGQVGTFLGASRTPLREAIKFLASEGLIDLIPSRGAVVKRFTTKEVRDMIEVISTQEQHAARRACADAPDQDIAHVRALHDQMLDCYRQQDRLNYYKLNQQIHSAIVALADNAALADMHTLMQNRLKRIRFIGHEGPEKWSRAVAEHQDMIVALKARDAASLAAILGKHLEQVWQRVRGSLES